MADDINFKRGGVEFPVEQYKTSKKIQREFDKINKKEMDISGGKIKKSAAEILTSQLRHIKKKGPKERKQWECKLALDCYKVTEEEEWHKSMVDLSNIPTTDLKNLLNEREPKPKKGPKKFKPARGRK